MGYRNLGVPSKTPDTTEGFVKLARRMGLLLPVVGIDAGRCSHCFGSIGGDFTTCFNCDHYGEQNGWEFEFHLNRVCPITYSPDDGLESLLHQYKRSAPGRERDFLATVLGCVLYEYTDRHHGCLDVGGAIDFATLVPPRQQRDFQPMQYAVARLDLPWRYPWEFDLVSNVAGARPSRGEVRPEFFSVGGDVVDKTILLVDDTWTSGSTMVSVAAALKEAGAARVVGLPIGRQIKAGSYGSSQELYEEAHAGSWSIESCMACDE